MSFGDTWSGPAHGEEFWDWMDAQRRESPLRKALLAEAQRAQNVVEIGCGAGHFLEALLDTGWTGKYRGYDFSAPALKAARKRGKGTNARFYTGDFMAKTVPPADLVVSCGVVQHQEEWLPMFHKALEVAPRAAFGVGYVGPRMRRRDYDGHHDWTFAPEEAKAALRAAGVNVLEDRLLDNPYRRTKKWRTEWLVVVGG